MLGPGDGSGAGGKGQGHMRASRADRDQVVDTLKSAFVQERLAKDELDDRTGRALAARTWEDLDALTVDIPAGPYQARPLALARPAAARPNQVQEPVTAKASEQPGSLSPSGPARKTWAVVIAAIILVPSIWAGVLGGPGAGAVIACLAIGVVFVAVWVIATYAVLQQRPCPDTGIAGPYTEQRAPAAGGERRAGRTVPPAPEGTARARHPRPTAP
jgi:hypothetical protein